jgi:type IV pilus assembly protein PilY1
VESAGSYISPLAPAGQCTKIFTVNPMFLVSNQDDNSDDAIKLDLSSGGLGGEMRTFTDIIRYMNDADLASGRYPNLPDIEGNQNITSYFLIRPTQINRTTIGYATAGGTGVPLPLSDDPEELVNALQDIFRQILSVSTTFVAASVPVNVFNRAEVVDNVYIALFQVDENAKPVWDGNVKKLRLTDIDGTTLLVDSLGNPAVAGDGRIRNDALTYWTLPGDLPPPDTAEGEVAGRDGRFVARGGAGQRVPGFLSGNPGLVNGLTTRRIYFDGPGGLQALNADLLTATALQGDLGAADTTEAAADIAYLRGLDVDDLDGDGDITEPREWIFNDPLHSRPLPLNYGARGSYTESNPAIFVAVASNDGMLHFIRNTTTGGAEAGVESWAFAPRSTMGAVSTLRANGSGVPHPYTVDGSPVAYIEDSNNNGTIEVGERAFLFFGLRRGGKAYYALDISDPVNPQLLWSIDKSGDFAELGYTFSTPRVGFMNLGSGPQPVVIFAGGYDMNKDTRGTIGTDDSEGNAIYVVDAETGALIWKAVGGSGTPSATTFTHPDLVDSIPATVSVADTDGDLLLDRIVVGDTGGNVWRADMPGSDPAFWKLTKLASLGRHAYPGSTNKAIDRRFFHRPDIVQSEDENGLFDAIVIGSGDRPDPLDLGGSVENWFYMIKDRNIAPGGGMDSALVHDDLGDVTDTCVAKTETCAADLTNGWRLELEDNGEKSLATPITIAGRVFFTTYIPTYSTNACGPSEGFGKLYAVSLKNAASIINYDSTDDDPNYPDQATSKDDRSTYLNSPGIPAEVVSIPPNQILRPDLLVEDVDVTTRWRTFWHLEENSDL